MNFKWENECSGCKYYSACGEPYRTEKCSGKELMRYVTIDGREMPIETKFRSIFDQYSGGDFGHSGEYFVIMQDKSFQYYAMTKECYYFYMSFGRKLSEKETAKFHGEYVRGMTEDEECKWDKGMIPNCHVDVWGNIKLDK